MTIAVTFFFRKALLGGIILSSRLFFRPNIAPNSRFSKMNPVFQKKIYFFGI
jgi:hypothetical protein